MELRTVEVSRYIKPLREGGSLPAIVQASDGYDYVLKFRGAGQGKKALIAELIGGLLAKTIGLNMPELVFMHLDDSFGKTEPDEEIQDLLKFSVGLNLGLHFLPGALTYDPLVGGTDATTASKVVVLDSLISNIDRTARNTNLLLWHSELWLIDHGASLYFHHNWPNWTDHLDRTFPLVKEHVLLEKATELPKAAEDVRAKLNREVLKLIVAQIPEEWLEDDSAELSAGERREAYLKFLCSRVEKLDQLVKEAEHAR